MTSVSGLGMSFCHLFRYLTIAVQKAVQPHSGAFFVIFFGKMLAD